MWHVARGMILTRNVFPGGAKRARTADPLLAKQVLFQLSYSPEISPKGTRWSGGRG